MGAYLERRGAWDIVALCQLVRFANDVKDRYPQGSSIPAASLVPPEMQPEYMDLGGRSSAVTTGIADAIIGSNLAAGREAVAAAIHAESGRSLTYADLAEQSKQVAQALVELGLKPGDRVAFRSGNVPEMLVTTFGIWRAGGAVVPTSVQARPDELRYFLNDSGARGLIVVGGSAESAGTRSAVDETNVEWVFAAGASSETAGLPLLNELASPRRTPLPEVHPDSVAIIWHTGGTTGQPKGCYHTHRRFLLGGYAVEEPLGVAAGQRWAAAAPVGHALGFIYHTIFTLLHGATAVFIEGFRDPTGILAAIAQYGIESFTAIMATWARMLEVSNDDSFDLSSLRRGYAMWQTASSSEVRERWGDAGIELMNNYGSTAFATWPVMPRADESFPPGALGRAVPGYEIGIVAPDTSAGLQPVRGMGRMAVRGVTGLTYWGRPAMQRRDVVDGWTLTDDLIELSANGNAIYRGRTDYLISTAGYKVAPGEVEEVLARHHSVSEVAVIGAPDPVRQQVVMAFIVPKAAAAPQAQLACELQDLSKRNLSPYKYPRRVAFVEYLPRDAVGKVQGKVLEEWAANESLLPALR